MASFDTVPFKVIPDGNFYPHPIEDEGVTRYTCEALFETLSRRNSIASRVSVVTEKRSIGTKTVTIMIDAGQGAKTLVIPVYGGAEATYTAVLTEMSGTKGYGREQRTQFTASLAFTIIGSSSVAVS